MEELTSIAFDNLDRTRTAVFIPISPIEGHGPHLPLGLDLFNAEYFAEQAASMAVAGKPEFDAVICRAIPLGTQLYKQPGSLKTDNTAVYVIARDMGASLAGWGFRFIFIVSGHGSPKDIVALEAAARKVSRRYKIQMHNLSGAMAVRFLRGEFIEKISAGLSIPLDHRRRELLKRDVHGGWWETSMMLYLKPDLVDSLYKTLPDSVTVRNPQYLGSPSMASAEFAEVSMRILSRETGDIIARCLSGEDISERTTSPLYRVLPLRPRFKRHLIMTIIVMIKLGVISWLIHRAIYG